MHSIINALRKNSKGLRPCPWLVYHLETGGYVEILQLLKSDRELDKIREAYTLAIPAARFQLRIILGLLFECGLRWLSQE